MAISVEKQEKNRLKKTSFHRDDVFFIFWVIYKNYANKDEKIANIVETWYNEPRCLPFNLATSMPSFWRERIKSHSFWATKDRICKTRLFIKPFIKELGKISIESRHINHKESRTNISQIRSFFRNHFVTSTQTIDILIHRKHSYGSINYRFIIP